MKRGTPELTKTKRLARRLGVPIYAAVGLLEYLWHWTARNARRGDVGRYDNIDIAEGIGWERDADELVAALTAEGWLDESAEHRLVVHDWQDHADDTTRKALEKAEETFVSGDSPRRSRAIRESVASDARTGGESSSLPSLALPIQAKPEPEPEPCTSALTRDAHVPDPAALVDVYNAATTYLPHVRDLTDDRRQKARTRLREHPDLEWWRHVFESAERLPFYRGEGKDGWRADFDWFVRNERNALRVLEQAENAPPPGVSAGLTGTMHALRDFALRGEPS